MTNSLTKNPMHDAPTLMTILDAWVSRGWLREIDLALTRFLLEESPDAQPALLLATALASHQLGRGHVCLDLENTLNDPYMALSLPPEQDGLPDTDPIIQPKDLLAGLNLSGWIEKLQFPDVVGSGVGKTPLVLTGHRLYLRRYWQYERQVERAIEDRLALGDLIANELPDSEFKAILSALFPKQESAKIDWQKTACALAARSAFSIITGGPGTGKTTTVVKLLALLQSIALAKDNTRPLQIRLAAPTGKAAARLKGSISGAIGRLPEHLLAQDALKVSIPSEVTTLHRLLGTLPGSRRFRHDARNPLPVDVLVVDEASMVDLEMMAAVLSALPDKARLILLGDKDQLASVEAGSVLGELCRRAAAGHFTSTTAGWISAMTGEQIDATLIDLDGLPLDQHIVMLRESHRFTSSSGIGRLAAAVNAGDSAQINEVWQGGYADIFSHELPRIEDARLEKPLLGEVDGNATDDSAKGYAYYLRILAKEHPSLNADKSIFDAWATKVLSAHSHFQVLCALRNGPFGVKGMNQRIEDLLKKHDLIRPNEAWYEGRPVIVTRNDYGLGLMNGDIGITLNYPLLNKRSGQLEWTKRVAFPKGDGHGGIRWVLPSRLLAVETVFALTVHKSQGSEFEHCALVLPPDRNPVLTRELVYTGITRGKKWFSLITVGNSTMMNEASSRTVQRSGGLFS